MTFFIRAAAWILLIAIAALSLVPASHRPLTGASHGVEHLAIFMISGVAFGLGYRSSRMYQAIGLICFAAAIELAQYFVPGRHARFSDFAVDSISACAGVLAAWLMTRLTDRWARMQRRNVSADENTGRGLDRFR